MQRSGTCPAGLIPLASTLGIPQMLNHRLGFCLILTKGTRMDIKVSARLEQLWETRPSASTTPDGLARLHTLQNRAVRKSKWPGFLRESVPGRFRLCLQFTVQFHENLAAYLEAAGVVGTRRQTQMGLPQSPQDKDASEILSSSHLPAAEHEVLPHQHSLGSTTVVRK